MIELDARSELTRGLAAQHAGDADTAAAAYRNAIQADPGLAAAHFNLGLLYRDRGDYPAALASFERATALRPGASDGWLHAGLCHEILGQLDPAVEAYRQSIAVDPKSAVAHFNLGNVERKRGRRPLAVAAFERAVELAPESPEVHLNLGNLLRETDDPMRAIAVLEQCLVRRPDHPEAAWNLSLANLAAGRLAEGWRLYEQRWARIGRSPDRVHAAPRWRGEALTGKHLVVWREQGLGDELMFATCLPDLVSRAARVTVAVDPRIAGLIQRAFPTVEVIDERMVAMVPADVHAPMGDLPQYLRPSRDRFPEAWSVFVPDRAAIVAGRARLGPPRGGLTVGVCWRSGLMDGERRRYYATLDDWAPILLEPGVRFINLQYDDCDAELARFAEDRGVEIEQTPGLDLKNDLEAVAGLIWHLDLVLTAPTAVSSLAAGLGVETWQLDPGNDWTLFGEQRSPWFPAIYAFRRPGADDAWTSPVEAMRQALVERRRAVATMRGREPT